MSIDVQSKTLSKLFDERAKQFEIQSYLTDAYLKSFSAFQVDQTYSGLRHKSLENFLIGYMANRCSTLRHQGKITGSVLKIIPGTHWPGVFLVITSDLLPSSITLELTL